MLANDRMKTASTEVTSIRRRNDKKNPRGEFIDISSILKVESTSKFPRQIDVIISTWILLSKSMKFRRRIDSESTKMCPLGFFQIKIDDILNF